MNWAGDVAWLIECLLATHKALGLVPSTTYTTYLGCGGTCLNPSTLNSRIESSRTSLVTLGV